MLKLVIRKWYVVYITWVKNVNKLRVNSSINSAMSSTSAINTLTTHQAIDVQLSVIHPSIHFSPHHLSTLKNTLSRLLFVSFPSYPQYLLLEPLKKIWKKR